MDLIEGSTYHIYLIKFVLFEPCF